MNAIAAPPGALVESAREVSRGLRANAPFLLGVFPFALVAGAASTDAGLSLAQVAGLSMFLFAGSAHLAFVDLAGAGAPVVVVAATAIFVNLRYLMFSAAQAPGLSHVPRGLRPLVAHLLTDETFAVWSGENRPSRAFLLGSGLSQWLVYVVGALIGASVGTQLPPDLGLDFAVVLSFIGLLVPTIRGRRGAGVAALVAGVAAVAGTLLPLHIGLVAAALLGTLAGSLAGGRDDA